MIHSVSYHKNKTETYATLMKEKIFRNKTIQSDCKVSKFRNYGSQVYATCATNIVKCMVGATLGFTTVLVAALYTENADIHVSVDDLGWISSYCFMTPVSSLFLGLLAQRIGNRFTMLIATVGFAISFLMFYFATSPEMLLSAQALAGLFYMIAMGPGITYVVEITQPPLRSVLTATTTLSSMTAIFLVVLLSNFFHWRTIALMILVFPVTGFIAVCTIPESPHWLASKKKFEKAEAALCWLRGWTSPRNVALEFDKLKETYMNPLHNADFPIRNNSNRFSFFKDTISFYLHRSFYIPLLSMCSLFILHSCTGFKLLTTYSIVMFRQINSPIDAHVAASIFDAMRILGALVCIILIYYTGKKKLTCASLIGAALTLFTSSTALLLKEYQMYEVICQWVASIALILTTFFTSAGIDKVIFILNGEVFPTKYRNVGSAIGLFINSVVDAVGNKLFLSLLDAVTLPGVFLIFGIACVITSVMVYFVFPETEGKTLQEIEDHYNNIRKS